MSGGRAGLNHHLVNMVMCSVNCLDELPRELPANEYNCTVERRGSVRMSVCLEVDISNLVVIGI